MSFFGVKRLLPPSFFQRQFVRSKQSAGTLVVSSAPRGEKFHCKSSVSGSAASGTTRQAVVGSLYYQRALPHWHWPDYVKRVNPRVISLFSKLWPLRLQSPYTQFDHMALDHTPPACVRGMKVLDRAAFRKTVQIPALKVPTHSIGILNKGLRKSLFHARGIKNIAELPDTDSDHRRCRLFLFDPKQHPSVESFTERDIALLESCGVDLTSWRLYDLDLTFGNWTHQEILGAILPEEADTVSGFSLIGHILHLNLRDDILGYKDIIGEVLLDKISSAKTIVNKTGTIDSTYRNFEMEVLAGEHNFITTTKENGLSFQFDFSKVYWNPRLSTEHQRIVSQVKKNDVVYDVFAGVGPFAVPAAKKGCTVHANDLNPESYKWLQQNFKLNKVCGEAHSYNLDGRAFVQEIVKPDLLARWQYEQPEVESLPSYGIHIVMNLPALAVQFLDTFSGLMSGVSPDTLHNVILPTVHCYCFSKASDPIQDAKDMAAQSLGMPLPSDCQVRNVRNVAPGKDMMCVVFRLQKALLLGYAKGAATDDKHTDSEQSAKASVSDADSPPQKKARDDTW